MILNPGDVLSCCTLEGFETVYLLLEPHVNVKLDPSRQARWKCLVLHREDDIWPNGKPGHTMWPSERELQGGNKL